MYASLAEVKLTHPALENGPTGPHITLAAEPVDEGVLRLDQEEQMVAGLRGHLGSRDVGRTGVGKSKECCLVDAQMSAQSVVSPGPTPSLNRELTVTGGFLVARPADVPDRPYQTRLASGVSTLVCQQ